MRSLKVYFDVIQGTARAKYLDAGLDALISDCRTIMQSCELCEHKCGVNRLNGETGICGVSESRVSTEFLHRGEEPELVPSHTIFFAGCNSRCAFCQNWDISQNPDAGIYIAPERLASIIKMRRPVARNVNWVGGEPTPNLLYILNVLKHLDVNTPMVWNSNMYMTERTIAVLNQITDLWLTDFKYGNNRCANRLSKLPKYFETVSRNHLLADGSMIIRHLVMPDHIECCTKPVLAWIADNLGTDVYVNIMDQYRPEYKAKDYKDICMHLPHEQYLVAVNYARDLGFK